METLYQSLLIGSVKGVHSPLLFGKGFVVGKYYQDRQSSIRVKYLALGGGFDAFKVAF